MYLAVNKNEIEKGNNYNVFTICIIPKNNYFSIAILEY